MSEICRMLRLSHTQLKNKIKQHDPFTIKSDTPFYKVATASIKREHTLSCRKITKESTRNTKKYTIRQSPHIKDS